MRTWILAVIAALGVTIGGFNVGRAADANCPTCTQEAQAGDALSIFLAMMQSAPPGAIARRGSGRIVGICYGLCNRQPAKARKTL